jgi:hypothetical protein
VVLALSGLAVAGIIFGYLELTGFKRLSPVMVGTATILCPPIWLTVLFFDAEDRAAIAFVWTLIGIVNAGLYVLVGKLVGKLRS